MPEWQPPRNGLTKLLWHVLTSAICSWLPSKWTLSELGLRTHTSWLPAKLGMFWHLQNMHELVPSRPCWVAPVTGRNACVCSCTSRKLILLRHDWSSFLLPRAALCAGTRRAIRCSQRKGKTVAIYCFKGALAYRVTLLWHNLFIIVLPGTFCSSYNFFMWLFSNCTSLQLYNF